MILYNGTIYDNTHQERLLNELESECMKTLDSNDFLDADLVIEACHQLTIQIEKGDFDDLIKPLLNAYDIPTDQFNRYVSHFKKEALIKKMQFELGDDYQKQITLDENHIKTIEPLGILFHIAAGNLDILPAYSVIEGLLAGNINLLKLPSGDQGVSVKLLKALIDLEPRLMPYIYVFDVPSVEVDTLKQIANIADAIVVWGGDQAILAARKLATPNTKLIEWGHKLSFAYASLKASDDDLKGLAINVMTTNQLLCSSAQGIYVDTNDYNEVIKFAKRFFEIFKSISQDYNKVPFGMHAKNAVELYYESMIKDETNSEIFKANGLSVITKQDSDLELSMLYRNVWVKPLPKEAIIKTLKPYKNYLQTASILASKEDFDKYAEKLKKAGIVRIKEGHTMSEAILGESHDGAYPLRLYTKIVESVKK
jgi:hypothetical protein